MKNKKFKLFASLTSLVMVVAVMAVGVWAATSAQASITGKVSFSATGVEGSINILENGTSADLVDKTYTAGKYLLESFDVNTSTSDASNGAVEISYEFDDADGDGFITGAEAKFTVKFQIANTGAFEMNYEVEIANTAAATNVVTAAAEATAGTWANNELTGTVAAETGIVDVTVTYTLNSHDGSTIESDENNIPEVTIKLTKVQA